MYLCLYVYVHTYFRLYLCLYVHLFLYLYVHMYLYLYLHTLLAYVIPTRFELAGSRRDYNSSACNCHGEFKLELRDL